MATVATVFVITDNIVIDGRCHYRVIWTTQAPQARILALQPATPHRLGRVYSEIIPPEVGHFVMRGVRRRLSSRHVHHDWYKATKDDVIDAVNEAVREAEARVDRPGH